MHPNAAITANTPNIHRAAFASPRSDMFTTTPARPAPNAPHISCTVLMAAAAVPPSAGSSTLPIAQADRCGQAMPTPHPVMNSASTHTATNRGDASSNWLTAASASPSAITNGATATMRTVVRVLLTEALTISLTVQPTDSATPTKPAATGTRWASRWPNSGTYMSAIVAAINSPS